MSDYFARMHVFTHFPETAQYSESTRTIQQLRNIFCVLGVFHLGIFQKTKTQCENILQICYVIIVPLDCAPLLLLHELRDIFSLAFELKDFSVRLRDLVRLSIGYHLLHLVFPMLRDQLALCYKLVDALSLLALRQPCF